MKYEHEFLPKGTPRTQVKLPSDQTTALWPKNAMEKVSLSDEHGPTVDFS